MKHETTGSIGSQGPLPVAYLSHYADLYGANRSLLDLMLALRADGRVAPFVIAAKEGPFTELLAEHGIPFATVPFRPTMAVRWYGARLHHRIRQWWYHERAALRARKENRRLLPTIIKLLQAQGIRLLHANTSLCGIGQPLALRSNLPWIWHIREMPELHYGMHVDAGQRGHGRALRNADRVIAVSKAVALDLQRYAGRSFHPAIVPNGVVSLRQYDELAARSGQRWVRPSPFRFVLVGLIHPNKGQEDAIRALALLKARHTYVELVLIGGGDTKRLQALAEELGVAGMVCFTGFMPDPMEMMTSMHAALMCSRHEAMGRVTVEAMACGLPVIGFASTGTLELIRDGVNGLLYQDGPEDLAQRMAELVADPAHARTLGENAARMAKERFTIERYADEVWALYRQIPALRGSFVP